VALRAPGPLGDGTPSCEAIMMTETRPPVSTPAHGGRSGNRSWYDVVEEPAPPVPAFEVVYEDEHGRPLIAFDAGQWYDVTDMSSGARPRAISVRQALRRDPAWSGAVVQALCSWMRRNPGSERSFDLATELALAVGELVRADASRR
jgi:hypothetical protein